MAFAKGKIKI